MTVSGSLNAAIEVYLNNLRPRYAVVQQVEDPRSTSIVVCRVVDTARPHIGRPSVQRRTRPKR
jgi:hypothetical protein